MKNYAICPVSDKRVNEKIARMNATLGVLFIIVFILTHNAILLVFLMTDFLLRAIDYARISPIANTSGFFVKGLNLNSVFINAGPKIFAARVGFLFLLSSFILFIMGFVSSSVGIASVLGIFCFLESTFGFCLACKIYPLLYNLLYKES